MAIIQRNAQPFYRAGKNGQCCLLIHGFTGSPGEMRALGDYLHAAGYSISGPLLPGHGTSPEDLAATAWEDWYEAVEKEYLRLKEDFSRVIPVGLSMGGILGLHLAARCHPPGIVVLSAPIYISNRRAYLAPLLKYFQKYHERELTREEREEELEKGLFYYRHTPLASLHSLLQLIRVVRKELPAIKTPALVIQGQKDRTVKPQSAAYIYRNLGSRQKELIWLEKSGHIITSGQEREQVFSSVAAFLERI